MVEEAEREFEEYIDYLFNETVKSNDLPVDEPVIFTSKNATSSIFGNKEHLVNIMASKIDASEYSVINFDNGVSYNGSDLENFQRLQFGTKKNTGNFWS